MPNYKTLLLLLAFTTIWRLQARAQTSSLGDPVFYENFGHGTNLTPVGPALAFERTRLDRTANKCPNVDQYGRGQYCIAFETSNCFDGTWRSLYSNHTPNDPYGYMMIINASELPDIVYTNTVSGAKMCAGAKYQFQFWGYNIVDEQPGINYQRPDIEFTVTKADGTPIPTIGTHTGPIPSTGDWTPYSVDFFAPADGADLIITLKNITTGTDIGNDIVLDDITVKPYGPVINTGFNTVNNTAPVTQCLNDGPAAYHIKSFQTAYLNPLYQWQVSFNNGAWANIPGKTQKDLDLNTEFQSPQTGKYQYRVGVLSAAGVSVNCQTFSDPLTINVFKSPDFALPPVTPVCEGQILSIHADKGSEYYWTLPDGSHSTNHFLDVTTSANQSNAGRYTVVITDNGCPTTTYTDVVVYPPLVASVDNENPTICEGTSTQLKANGGTIYKWLPAEGLDHDDIANPIANPTTTTEYSVSISNGGCSTTRTVTVTVLDLPVADAGADFTMQETAPAKLHGKAVGGTFYWTPTDYMDDPTSLTPTINPPDNQTYTLHVESTNCGTVSNDVTVTVLKKITIPNTFTPNNDGVNDTWNIDKLITYPESTLSVYTRDGREVFKTTGAAKQWNGTYAGKALPAGVYYYVIDLKNNLPNQAGWVMLVR
jgi:gliding motility-associated-like protein